MTWPEGARDTGYYYNVVVTSYPPLVVGSLFAVLGQPYKIPLGLLLAGAICEKDAGVANSPLLFAGRGSLDSPEIEYAARGQGGGKLPCPLLAA